MPCPLPTRAQATPVPHSPPAQQVPPGPWPQADLAFLGWRWQSTTGWGGPTTLEEGPTSGLLVSSEDLAPQHSIPWKVSSLTLA